jgi:hypothetical protein
MTELVGWPRTEPASECIVGDKVIVSIMRGDCNWLIIGSLFKVKMSIVFIGLSISSETESSGGDG